jgi:alpha-glucosidase
MNKVPWYKKAVLYQIYPRSFYDANGDGIGDLPGITQKLDYLAGSASSLGVSAIWLSPIYASPMKDFGYDITDHCAVDSTFGTMDDFDQFVAEAHKRNIKVMMDYVPNHTSDQHEWFVESRSSRSSSKRDWYIWANPGPDDGPPNDWLSIFGGSAWEYDDATGQYYLHSFLKEQPDLNWRNPQLRDAMFDVLRFWITKGVDGFRTDAFDYTFNDVLLRDEPENEAYHPGDIAWLRLRHIYTTNQPEIAQMYSWFEEIFEEFPDKQLYMVTENFFAGEKDLTWHYSHTQSNGHFAPLNLHLPKLPWSARSYREFIDRFEQALGENDWPNYSLGNHDLPRVASRYGDEQARIAAMLLLTLRGLPVLYYGDEIGLKNGEISVDDVHDPVQLREPTGGVGRDPERTPMQWSNSDIAGFSDTNPWLPISEDYKTRNVDELYKDPTSLLSLYRQLIRLRNSTPALLVGSYASKDVDNEYVFAYTREYEGDTILIVLNFSDDNQPIDIGNCHYSILVDTDMSADKELAYTGTWMIPKNTGYVLVKK